MDEYTVIIIVMRTIDRLYRHTLRLKDLNRGRLGDLFSYCDSPSRCKPKISRRFAEFYSFSEFGTELGYKIWDKYPDPFTVFNILRRSSQLITTYDRVVVAKVQAFILLTEVDEYKRYLNDECLEGNYPYETCAACEVVCGNDCIDDPRRCRTCLYCHENMIRDEYDETETTVKYSVYTCTNCSNMFNMCEAVKCSYRYKVGEIHRHSKEEHGKRESTK